MNAASTNGVNHDGNNRLPSPSTNGQNGAQPPGDAPSANEANGRDARGRFAKGNAGGPGNPFARRMAKMRSVLCAAVGEEDVAAVARTLIEQAKAGDVAAARLLLAYAVGQPTPAVDPDTLDAQEWQVLRQLPVPAAEVGRTITGVPTDFACKLVRTLAPYLGKMAAAKAREFLHAAPEPEVKRGRRCKRRKRSREANPPEMAGPYDCALRPLCTRVAASMPPSIGNALARFASSRQL